MSSIQNKLADRQSRRAGSSAASPVRGSSSTASTSTRGSGSSKAPALQATSSLDSGKPRKVKIQVEFEITLQELSGLDDHEGQFATVTWKRGGKPQNKGATPQAMVKRGSARWDHSMTLLSVLVHHTGTGAFQSKSLQFGIEEVDSKGKKKTLGSADMNLGTYCSAKNPEAGDQRGPWGRVERVALPLDMKGVKKGAPNAPRLTMTIKSRWVKFDGKNIVPLKADEAGKERKSRLTYAGNEFGLETDPDGQSENTTLGLSSIMDSHDDGSEISDAEMDDDDDEPIHETVISASSTSKASKSEDRRQSQSNPISGFVKLGKKVAGGGGGGGAEERAVLSRMISSIEEECRSLSDSAALGYWLGFSTSLLGLLCNASKSSAASTVRDRLQHEGLHASSDSTPSASEIRGMASEEKVLWVLYLVSHGVQQRLVKSFFPVIDEIVNMVSPNAAKKFEGDVVSKPLYKVTKMLRPFNLPPIILSDVAYSMMYALRARLWNNILDKPDRHCTFRYGLRLKLAVAETKNWVINSRFFRRQVVMQPLDFLQDVAGVLVVDKFFFDEGSVDDYMRTFVNISVFELRSLLKQFVACDDVDNDVTPSEDVFPKLDVACNRLQSTAPKDLHYELLPSRFPEK